VLTTQPTRRTKRMLSFAFVVVLLIVIGALDAEVGDQHSSVQQRRRMGMSIFISFIDFERDNPIIVSTFSLSIFVAIYWNMRAQGLQNIVFAASSSMLIIFVLLFLPNILNHPRGVAPTSQSIGRSITLNQSKYVDAGTDEQKIEQPRLVVEWVKPASNSSHPHSRVVVAQTCGHGAYLPLLAETRRVNERYALGQGFAYLIVTGLYHGNTEWHSTFNKAFILRAVLMDETQYEILHGCRCNGNQPFLPASRFFSFGLSWTPNPRIFTCCAWIFTTASFEFQRRCPCLEPSASTGVQCELLVGKRKRWIDALARA